ncbi:MAG: TetR/AcrR family transcriptional regulator [Actinomycetota bacterium]|nr:TetR/AcrR family transcriptional regulator [Actinomycetota bacterium]
MRPDVKRSYDSTGRQRQAEANRVAVVDAAERLFRDAGYAATSVASVADEAGVSVQTVYRTFRGKPGLVRAIYERGLRGAGGDAAYERSDSIRERAQDPRELFRRWGELTTEVASVVSPIRLLMRSAALSDPEMEDLLRATDEERLVRMRHHAEFLQARGFLRPGVRVAEATDVLWTTSSVELYDLLVLQRGWTHAAFADFVAELMTTALVGGHGSARSRSGRP